MLKVQNILTRLFLVAIVISGSSLSFAQQNHSVSRTYIYDENGQVKFWPNSTDTMYIESRTYFDQSGRLLQNQSRVNSHGTSGIVLANQPIYDRFGRGAVNTLSAPIGNDGTFGYKNDFVLYSGSTVYDYQHFDLPVSSQALGEVFNPYEVGGQSTQYTLGWYYGSNSNSLEDGLAVTKFPYTRKVFDEDGTNEVTHSTLPGETHRAGQGYEVKTELLELEDELEEYMELRHLFVPMDELIKEKAQAAVGTHITDDVVATDASAYINTTVYVAPTGSFTLEPGFDSDGEELDIRTVGVAFYANLKEKGKHTQTIDPNGRVAHVFTDQSGNTVATAYSTVQNSTLRGWAYNIYDDNQRLIASISPNGLEQWRDGVDLNNIDKTTYTYNYRGWLLSMTETDAGTTTYKYRNDGKIRFSQNAKQAVSGVYSYTNYDVAGRPVESGEVSGGYAYNSDYLTAGTQESILEETGFTGGVTGTRNDWLKTYYDIPATNIQSQTGLSSSYVQDFLMGAVSYSESEEMITWYSYDDAGQVTWMLQRPLLSGLDMTFATEYTYDLNGNVLETTFKQYNGNPGTLAYTFIHKYTYDDDLRLIEVETSEDGTNWTTQAEYEYYLHGPLKRVELADTLQGIDYRYTVQGWLKSINHPESTYDPGADDTTTNGIFSDAFGMTLEYFDGDYAESFSTDLSIDLGSTATELYDGNITGITWHAPLTKFNSGVSSTAYVFNYDEKYQLLNATFGSANFSNKSYTANSSDHLKLSGLEYDANGNIQQLERYSNGGVLTDDFGYTYQQNTNQLTSVSSYADYTYNEIGQMVTEAKDSDEQNLTYDVSGKVTEVRDENNDLKVSFDYDDRGFRLRKTVYQDSGNDFVTWYIRDASGALMASYDNKNTNGTYASDPSLKEVIIYGSGKLGTLYPAKEETLYELTDHLGNVRAIVSQIDSVKYEASFEDGLWSDANPLTSDEEDFFDFPNESRDRIDDGSMSNKVARVPAGADGLLGPSMTLMVMPGDSIRVNVEGGFASGSTVSYNANSSLLGAIMTGLTGSQDIGEAMRLSIEAANPSAGVVASINNSSPETGAYVNWLYFDNDFNFITGGFDDVPAGTAIDELGSMTLSIPATVINQPGFVYIYTTNENTSASEAYFDEFDVTHYQGIIRSTADFYPFGSEITERSFSNISPRAYRFGYQGQFAEKDGETGWNAFELRMLDAEIGRWLTTDPFRQYNSPYLGNGNNPITMTDPTGGLNPIYGSDGKFRGVDEFGLQGDAIIYDGNFTNGMSQQDILSNGGVFMSDFDLLSIDVESAVDMMIHYNGLSSRPDWDGLITKDEALMWYNQGNGRPLYVDIGQINFKSSQLSTTDFQNGKYLAVNFFYVDTHPRNNSIKHRPSTDQNVAIVYGTLGINLLDKHSGRIGLQTSERYGGGFDQFDFNIKLFEWIADKSYRGTGTPFNFMGYGTGSIHLTKPGFKGR